MASTKPYKFSYGEQINQYTSYNYTANLALNTVASLTVPSLSNIDQGVIAVITCRTPNDTFIAVSVNSTPEIPVSSTFALSNCELINNVNIMKKRVESGDVLSFISSADNTYVGVSFYTANSF